MNLSTALDTALDLLDKGFAREKVLQLFDGPAPPPSPARRSRRQRQHRGAYLARFRRTLKSGPKSQEALVKTAGGIEKSAIRVLCRLVAQGNLMKDPATGLFSLPPAAGSRGSRARKRPTSARHERPRTNPFTGRKLEEPSLVAPTPST